MLENIYRCCLANVELNLARYRDVQLTKFQRYFAQKPDKNLYVACQY